MRQFALAAAIIAAGTASAFAADLPARPYTKAPPPPVPVATGGIFFSLAGGYVLRDSSNDQFIINPLVGPGGFGSPGGYGDGITGRGTIGYRWPSNWDINFGFEGADFKNGPAVPTYFGFPGALHSPDGKYHAFDGEVGYSFRSSYVLRLFAGARYAKWSMTDSDGQVPPFTFAQNNKGWGPRAGFQFSMPVWQSVGVFVDGSFSYIFGDLTATAAGLGTGTVRRDLNITQWDAKGGLEFAVFPQAKLAVGYQVSDWNNVLSRVEYDGFGNALASGSVDTIVHGPFARFTYNH